MTFVSDGVILNSKNTKGDMGMNEIENWYDNEYEEWNRLERHKIEFEITKHYLDRYITKPESKIFDIGGGPGRYSIYLAKQGHKVTLLDLSGKNVCVAKEKAAEAGVVLEDCVKGDALALPEYEKESFDVILLMGPLYHLTKAQDRKKAVEEARKLLKKGGILIAAFISKYAPIQDCFSYLDFYEDEVKELLHYLEDGKNNEGGFTTAYFTSVEEARSLMQEQQFKELAFVGVENILGCKEQEILKLPNEEQKKWLELGIALAEDEKLYGTSQHFLYIGEK